MPPSPASASFATHSPTLSGFPHRPRSPALQHEATRRTGSRLRPLPPELRSTANTTATAEEEFFAERGIDMEIAQARPYPRYYKNDYQAVRDEYAGLSRGQRSTMSRFASRCDGLIIHRHA